MGEKLRADWYEASLALITGFVTGFCVGMLVNLNKHDWHVAAVSFTVGLTCGLLVLLFL